VVSVDSATHQFFLTRRSLYLLLDDTRKNHKSVSDEGFKHWLELIELFGDYSPVLIFQNETPKVMNRCSSIE
jgi:internalin A